MSLAKKYIEGCAPKVIIEIARSASSAQRDRAKLILGTSEVEEERSVHVQAFLVILIERLADVCHEYIQQQASKRRKEERVRIARQAAFEELVAAEQGYPIKPRYIPT